MVIGAEREPELETGNGHTSCIMWSTCTCGSCLDLRDEHRVSCTPKGKLFMGVSSMWVGVVIHFSGEYYEYTMGTLI